MHSSRHAEAREFCKLVKAVKKREEEKCEEEKREEAPHCDLLPSLNSGGGSQFIHPTYPSAFSLGAAVVVSRASLRVGPTLGPHSEQ